MKPITAFPAEEQVKILLKVLGEALKQSPEAEENLVNEIAVEFNDVYLKADAKTGLNTISREAAQRFINTIKALSK